MDMQQHLETLRPRIGCEQISPDEIQHDFLVYDTWMIFEIEIQLDRPFFWWLWRLESYWITKDVGQTIRIEVFDWNQIVEHVLPPD